MISHKLDLFSVSKECDLSSELCLSVGGVRFIELKRGLCHSMTEMMEGMNTR